VRSNVAAGVYRLFQIQVMVVRSNAAREAGLNSTVSLNHFIPLLLLQVMLEILIFFSLNLMTSSICVWVC
jgi:hypothetical protein